MNVMPQCSRKIALGTIFALIIIALTALGSSAPVSAVPVLAQADYVSSAFNLFDDPTALQAAVYFAQLNAKAEAGDQDALRKLQFIGRDFREAFPRGNFLGKDWYHATHTAANAWVMRRFESVNFPTEDSTPRLQSAGAGLVPYRSPAPAFSRNVLVTRDVGTPIQNEPHLCVNPEDSQNVVVVSHNYGVGNAPAQTSFDGGQTWQGPQRVPITQMAYFSGDPVVACGRGSKVYYNFMSVGEATYNFLGLPVDITKSDIAVSRSDDGGLTWQRPSTVATNRFEFEEYTLELQNPETGELVKVPIPVIAISFLDKNWIGIGPNPVSPDEDALYVSYTNFTSYMMVVQPLPGIIVILPLQWTSEIEVHRSLNGSQSWERIPVMDPVPGIVDIADLFTGPETDTREIKFRTVQDSQLAVDASGVLYASWYDSTNDGYAQGESEIYVARSQDGGDNWSKPVLAARGWEVQRWAPPGGFRNSISSNMAVSASGEAYIVYSSLTPLKPSDDGDIYFVRGGLNRQGVMEFTEPAMINRDHTNNIQFFPAIAVAPDGSLHVMWGDTRDDPLGLKYHIYYTKSEDGGKTWGFEVRGIREADTRVTDFPSNPNKGFPQGRFIGDYWGIAATGDDVYMVWTDSRLGEYGPINQKIGFARRSAIGSPSVYLNPGRGPSGQEVTVQVFDFQPDMSVFVRVGSDISSCGGKTNGIGFTECAVLMPVAASEGIVNVFVFDESGNFATASFFTEVGIDDLARKDDVSSVSPSVDDKSSAENQNDGPRVRKSEVLLAALFVSAVLLAMSVMLLYIKRLRKQEKSE